MATEQTFSDQPTMTKEEAIRILTAELEKGRRSGEEEGWLTAEEVSAYFEEKSRNEKMK